MYNQNSSLEAGKAAIIRMVEQIREQSTSQEFITKHKIQDVDFSRHRDIEFGDIINAVLGKSGTSLDFEIKNYFKDLEKSVTSSAFCLPVGRQVRHETKLTIRRLKNFLKRQALKSL